MTYDQLLILRAVVLLIIAVSYIGQLWKEHLQAKRVLALKTRNTKRQALKFRAQAAERMNR